MSEQYKNFTDNPVLVTDERFAELTGGMTKDEFCNTIVTINGVLGEKSKHAYYKAADGQAMEVFVPNGYRDPAVQILTENTSTTFHIAEVPDGPTQCFITVVPLNELEAVGPMTSTLEVGRGMQLQDEADFALIPDSYWTALRTIGELLNPEQTSP